MGSLKVKASLNLLYSSLFQLCCAWMSHNWTRHSFQPHVTKQKTNSSDKGGPDPAAIQTQVGQILTFLPQSSCVKHRPPGKRASATSAPQPAASARSGATSRTGGCPGRWEPPPGLCLLSWRASLSVWGKGEPKHSVVRAVGSQARDQSRADVSSAGTAAAVFARAAWQGSAVLHADAK